MTKLSQRIHDVIWGPWIDDPIAKRNEHLEWIKEARRLEALNADLLEALKGAWGVLYSASCYLGTSFRDDAKYWHEETDVAIRQVEEQMR